MFVGVKTGYQSANVARLRNSARDQSIVGTDSGTSIGAYLDALERLDERIFETEIRQRIGRPQGTVLGVALGRENRPPEN